MTSNRREFLKAGVIGAAAVSAGVTTGPANAADEARSGTLNILILGGTGFIGPHMVREALRRGHGVTLFNRGRTNNALFPDLETIKGDRDGGLDGLVGRQWDAVIDNSGYIPRHVRDSARLLADASSQYVFVSTISTYASFAQPNDESSALGTIDDESIEEVTGETYGPLKVLCERAAREEYGEDRLTVLRPTYICGPGDHTDRFSYWPVRTSRGGDMLWPGAPTDAIQIIDVRDLANFTIDALEERITGIYNTVTPVGSYTMGNLLEDSQAVSARTVQPVWVDEAFAVANGAAGRGLPIWHPPTGDSGKAAAINGEKAVAAGLHNRPVRETIRDLLQWWQTLPAERTAALSAGLSSKQEDELIAKWRKQRG